MQISPERREELIRLAEAHKDNIDFSDVPFLGDEAWESAEVGRFYRGPKQPSVVHVDADIVSWFKTQEGDFESRINEILRKEMQAHQETPA